MVNNIKFPQSKTIFSHSDHLSSLKKRARLVKAKMFSYQASKWSIVALLCFGLVSAGTLHATAGNYKKSQPAKHKTINKIQKKVKVRAGNNNNFGNGNGGSKASVNNDNSVHIGGSNGGGRAVTINRGGGNKKHNNDNNGSKKKVVKRVKRVTNVDNSYVDNSYTDNSYADNSDYTENNVSQEITNKYVVKQQPANDCYDNCYVDHNNDWGYYSDDCGCYHKPGKIEISNNNNNYNDNYNSQYVKINN